MKPHIVLDKMEIVLYDMSVMLLHTQSRLERLNNYQPTIVSIAMSFDGKVKSIPGGRAMASC